MSKYKPLSDRLSGQPSDEWRASFADIEAVLGFPLPKAARTGKAWWSKPPHSETWTQAGWNVGLVDPIAGTVTFRKERPAAADPATGGEPVAAVTAAPQAAPRSGRHLAGVAAMAAGSVAVAVGLGALAFRAARRGGSKTSL